MSRKILVADDSDAIRSVAVNLFRQKGHEVLTASGGAEAWEILKSGKIDLAILNSRLSGMDGYTISKLIKEDSSTDKTKAMLLLSPSEIVNQHQLITAQPDGTLNKPFTPPDLLSKAGEILGEDFGMKDNQNDESQQISVSEMGMNGEDVPEEIDFESVFDDDDTGSSDVEDVHFSDVLDENKDSSGDEIEDDSDSDDEEDDDIKLADDQFGLEEPFDPPEVETPHDYNWFIREMKNEIEGSGDDKKKKEEKPQQSAKPKKASKKAKNKPDDEITGHFTVEEIGTTKVYPEGAKETQAAGKAEPGSQKSTAAKSAAASEYTEDDGKLALAEKLLVKELSRQLAQKIIDKMPREKLRQLLEELFTELKRY
ncbi:MAG: response regulator [candidate division Zixibacteria bacterium]|nr:response regulator [candidate division Zixibacteria bacterium]